MFLVRLLWTPLDVGGQGAASELFVVMQVIRGNSIETIEVDLAAQDAM